MLCQDEGVQLRVIGLSTFSVRTCRVETQRVLYGQEIARIFAQ